MSICIFPGSFNPIHEGHLKMARHALEKYNFDKIIFIPAYLPPHKEIDKNLAKHRYRMVELAISKKTLDRSKSLLDRTLLFRFIDCFTSCFSLNA